MAIDVYQQDVLDANTPLDPSRREPQNRVHSWGPLVAPHHPNPVLPNLSDWAPGDILLFASNPLGDPVGSMIQNAQERWLQRRYEHARWVHTAIYLDRGTIIESIVYKQKSRTPGGPPYGTGVYVHPQDLGARLQTGSPLRVRRIDPTRIPAACDGQHAGYRLAMHAASWTGADYNFYAIWRMVVRRLFALLNKQVTSAATFAPFFQNYHALGSTLCSQLVDLALREAKLPALSNSNSLPPLPFVLSESDLFNDVPLSWRETQ